ncbi:hypothetical protein FQR65_LT00746 [Abscondita terminalis]|nr:hypothetical protein FQR65_LT00746 [Abscondita terminalis]
MADRQHDSEADIDDDDWYEHCDCCPYGYHIDLDFIRYCDSLQEEADRNRKVFVNKRRERRLQRQSMEVLLGLEPPPLTPVERFYNQVMEDAFAEANKNRGLLVDDDFDEAISDFERTLQRSKTIKLSKNLPDVTAVNGAIPKIPSTSSSRSSTTALPTMTDAIPSGEYDLLNFELCSLSPLALQNIREQLALGLERTKELEEQVKLIPSLQGQISVLKEENRQLLLERKAAHDAELNVVNGNSINSDVLPDVRLQLHTLTHSNSFVSINEKEEHQPSPVPRRDFGVMHSVLTRNVGVGHHPYTKSVATTTVNGEGESNYTDKWYKEKVKFLTTDGISTPITNISMNDQKVAPILVGKETQTLPPTPKRQIGIQTTSEPKVQSVDSFTQSFEEKKVQHSIGVLAKVASSNIGIEAIVPTQSLGTSNDTIDGNICTNCTDKNKIREETGSAISLASLSFPRSKSFNLGDDKLNLAPQKCTIGCQYVQMKDFISHKACQYESKTQSKTCQTDVKLVCKGVQYENLSVAKFTDTKDLRVPTKDIGCDTIVLEKQTSDVAVSTSFEDLVVCATPLKKPDEKFEKKDDFVSTSRIPRPLTPTTIENRKFKRQNTYTKIPAVSESASGLSGLDLNAKHDNELPSPLEKVKQNCKISSNSQNGVGTSKREQQDSILSLPDSDLCQGNRKKAKPSKEMQAAMKVLNDSLEKGHTKNLKSQLKNAINIIQQEWFKISSSIIANPLDVEDYLDCFEEISSDLLYYIVNVVDASGNTAMHYAVSHGNFDVVSILLDSKVCDINRPNKAGYTSVMLVSLVEVGSPTHANVVRRLFQLADVNIRAKQHGQTALMLAVSHGRLDMVRLLLEAGADINIQDEDGSTALMCASEHGHIEIVKHFLNQPDCDCTITDGEGSSALKIAMEAGHSDVGVLLYAHVRNLHGVTKLKRLSISITPKASSPLPMRSSHRAFTDIKPSK